MDNIEKKSGMYGKRCFINDIYSNVVEKSGGPYSLYCTSCKRWIPNTANAEMRKEGFIAHSHSCVNGIWTSTDDMSIADEN